MLTIAVAGDTVLIGRARTYGTEGTFTLMSLDEEALECRGRFRYDALPSGRARFRCSSGESGSVRIESEGHLIGRGRGTSSLGPIQLVFGYTIEEANRRLRLPAGKMLMRYESGIALVDIENEEGDGR
ncbi:MAG: hypothetical protein AB7O54_11565 [Pseudomonadales bacterium]